jgi:hypothetical protein
MTAELGRQNTVPVGMGIVVPASKIIEVLESTVMYEKRARMKKIEDDAAKAKPE